MECFSVTSLCRVYLKVRHQHHEFVVILFDFGKMMASLAFSYNAIFRVLSGHTTVSGVPENDKIDTKITKPPLFC